jgi:uncharacterized repeat protein (TIGR01451 family)
MLYFTFGFATTFAAPVVIAQPPSLSQPVPADVASALTRGEPQELIILFDDRAIESEAAKLRGLRGYDHDTPEVLDLKAARFRLLKQEALAVMAPAEYEVLIDYSHLPMALIRFNTRKALDRLVAHPSFIAAYRNGRKFPILDSQSANLVGQPAVAALGPIGSGASVLVIDTGVNYTLSDFGSCSSPGVPASCKVAFYQNIADSSSALDSNGHGTNVSGITVGIAPGAKIEMMNVFGANTTTTDALIIQAINWGIANRAAYNIRSINMSLGDGTRNTAPCTKQNPFVTPFANVHSAGMQSVVASGNEGYTDGIANPACTPGAVSVGAVYSGNFGAIQWLTCTDSVTGADRVTCFSDSASFLSMLAPGALITAAGSTYGGTSQATPFVAAAFAVLQAAFPAESVDQSLSRMTLCGVAVTDSRNSIVKPRLNLLGAIRPANDNFANRIVITGTSGKTSGTNLYASKEVGEPNHAGNSGGASVWWSWTAPATGQVSLDTRGSSFDTLLAVYTGTPVSSLSSVATNTTPGGASNLLFQANAGTEYKIAVDGVNGVSGSITLNWSLNTSASADLSISESASPNPASVSAQMVFSAIVRNNGPQTATNVKVVASVPSNATVSTIPTTCAQVSQTITCNLGTLASSSQTSLSFTFTATAAGTATSVMSVSSDLPDPVSANNNASASVTVQASGGGGTPVVDDGGDVPTLPEWATLLLGLLLIALARRHRS